MTIGSNNKLQEKKHWLFTCKISIFNFIITLTVDLSRVMQLQMYFYD